MAAEADHSAKDGAPGETDVTPEMIEAGVTKLAFYNSRDTYPEEQAELVRDIYRAMKSRRGKQGVAGTP